MIETLSTVAANGSDPGHDIGFSYSPAAHGAPPVAGEAPAPAGLRAEIRALLSASPLLQPEDTALLALMGQHDAALGAALSKLPEREGPGGATVALLARKYRGAVDVFKCVRMTAATLIFWPDEVAGDEQVEEAALRLAEFNLDAAKELARAYVYLGSRFTLKHSLRVVLDKYGISAQRFTAVNGTTVDSLTPAGIEAMLAQGQIDLVNEILRPFEIAIRQKIGTVNPVFSLLEKNNGRHVMPTRELLEFLRKRNVFL